MAGTLLDPNWRTPNYTTSPKDEQPTFLPAVSRASPERPVPANLPPGPAEKVELGVAERDPLRFLLDLTSKYGDIVRYESAYGPTYLVNDPECIGTVFLDANYPRGSLLKAVLGEGLLASEGNFWLHQRRLIQPYFHQKRIAALAPLIIRATLEMLDRWRRRPVPEAAIDVAAEMARLTMEIVIGTLFSGDLNEEAEVLRLAFSDLMLDIGGLVTTEFGAPLKISPARNARFKDYLRTIDRIIYGAIRGRRQAGADEKDMLSLLLHGRDEAGEGLSDRQVRDEVVTMVFAGSETTAMMLGWTWHLLLSHPESEARLYSEVDEVLARQTAKFADVARLEFTRMVMEESMRLRPPVWAVFRRATADAELGGYHITGGAKMIVSPYAMHRHPRYWPEPERFDPERFSEENSADRPRHAYLPFGGGRHICIGNFLAMMEGQLILATIAQHYRLRPAAAPRVEPQPLVTLRPKNGVMAFLDPR